VLIRRIVSGGQSGADRAALDAAIGLGVEYGGWCPAGGWAEDLPDPPGLLAAYPGLRETPSADPAQRTEWNVRDSDATLILVPAGVTSPGTLLTEALAKRMGRPLLRLDPSDRDAVAAVIGFVQGDSTGTRLNVAGPRESEASGLHAAARLLLEDALRPIADS